VAAQAVAQPDLAFLPSSTRPRLSITGCRLEDDTGVA